MIARLATSLLLLLAPHLSAAGPAPSAANRIEFNRDVRPILSDNCFSCHGPDKSHREADLRLDQREEALAAKAIVAGKSAESELIARILSKDPDEIMPPPESHKKLSAAQQDILRRWIDQGANYQQHWSYEAPVKQAVPAGQHPVDFFIGQRLKARGLAPSPRADARTLIRRLHFDLTGLPPSPQEVTKWSADLSPQAYARLVDKLLKSPHYGERMAIGWLDVVRFADTIGYHSDNPRNVWPYRDYVIASFNANKPFDRFTLEQVAGDLLPDANRESRIGSAFNRLLLSTEEGGAQAKDYEQRMLTDRVRAVGAAWMGQTTGCAQCHDHKFDPISTRDFYTLGAFFADIKEPIIGRREDGMLIASAEQEAQLATLDSAVAQAKAAVAKLQPELAAARKTWEAQWLARDAKEAAKIKDGPAILALLKNPKRNPRQNQQLDQFFEQESSLHRPQREALARAEAERKAYYESLPKCLVSVSDSKKRTVRVLPRGNWMDESGEVVQAALPSYLPKPPPPKDRELNRLDLAQWLVARNNPLTARTVMNRLWKQFFGTGLSKVLDDLGAQGEPPIHPALLDWLACEFMDSGWDLQHMIRIILTSHSYQQTSNASPQLLAADPDNRECARQSAFRLDAELVRDNALSIAGLLVPKIGGPSVKPYQPAKYWENLNFPTREWQNDNGESLYRRGLYTWWQRSFLHPAMMAFDAPSREECTAERNRSNIPQQALILLNDTTYIEAARVFAQGILKASGTQGAEAVNRGLQWAMQQALQRAPSPQEQSTLKALFDKHLADYRRDPAAAKALLQNGAAPTPAELNAETLAAWTHIARVLLNLHETITRA